MFVEPHDTCDLSCCNRQQEFLQGQEVRRFNKSLPSCVCAALQSKSNSSRSVPALVWCFMVFNTHGRGHCVEAVQLGICRSAPARVGTRAPAASSRRPQRVAL